MIVSEGSVLVYLGKALWFVAIGWIGWVTTHVLTSHKSVDKKIEHAVKKSEDTQAKSQEDFRQAVKETLAGIEKRTERIENLLLENRHRG